MPRRARQNPFNLGTLINVATIPILAAGFSLTGFYYLTGDTLKRHDEAIKIIQVEAKTTNAQEQKSREESRKQFLDSQAKTADILGKLDTRLAVAETKQEAGNQTLTKIADELTRLTTGTLRRQ